jgi:PAT family beta-lactamase induction signal transducer AmpG
MRLPNLLATRNGRLTAFFFLYLTEGIPLGFTATAIATQMRREGVGPDAIGAFVGSLYLPWAFKWAVGPFVDVLSSDRFGRRRMWIVLAQVLMVATLLAATPVSFSAQIQLFTLLILVHNVFGATQDVAIDALAVNTLSEKERGLANGLMFGGAFLGQALGGSGVLFLTPHLGFEPTFFVVAAWILSVTLLVALPMREPPGPPREPVVGSRAAAVGRELKSFLLDTWRAFTGSRAASVAVLFALLPAGAYSLGLALQSNLAVELGLTDPQVATLNLWSTVLSGSFCVLGGWLSDRFGRRLMLGLFLAGTVIPTLYLATVLNAHGWVMPVAPDAPDRPVPAPALVGTFWAMTLLAAVFQGLRYGSGTAIFMDVTTPRVAATQFTAYMALSNLAISYSATWQGLSIVRWGYPVTLLLDSAAGLVCLSVLPFLRPVPHPAAVPPPAEAIPEGVPT